MTNVQIINTLNSMVQGTKIELTNGKIGTFIRMKRKKFIVNVDGALYDASVEMFSKVVGENSVVEAQKVESKGESKVENKTIEFVNINCSLDQVKKYVYDKLNNDKPLLFKVYFAVFKPQGERKVSNMINSLTAMYWDIVMDSEGFEFDGNKIIKVMSIESFINDLETA